MKATRFATDRVDLDRSLRVLAMLPGDPTLRLEPGRLTRATHTPHGPGTISADWEPGGSEVDVRADGPGGDWLLARAPALLGLADTDAVNFEPEAGPLRDLWRRHAGLRVPRTGTVWHDLCWIIVQQRVQRVEAADQWRRLVQRHGTPAPGEPGLLVPPSADHVAGLASFEFHQVGVERRRADVLRAAARVAHALHPLADRTAGEAAAVLGAVPGVGGWTTSTMSAITWGDPDAVILGDSGIPSLVGWTLANLRRVDDDEMVRLLEPYRPHRYRVVQLAFLGGRRPPRRGPHRSLSDITLR